MPRKRSLPNSEIAPEVTASSAGTGAAAVRKMEKPVAEKKTRNRANQTVKHSNKSVAASDVKEVVDMTKPIAATPASGPVSLSSPEDLQREIAQLAYRFWEDRGRTPGDPVQDWLKAEQELLSRFSVRH